MQPERQGRGLGSLLLGSILPRDVAATTFSSADPRALPLYLRAGLAAWWPNLYLRGETSGLPAAGLAIEPLGPEAAANLEASLAPSGERTDDHRHWAALPGGSSFQMLEAGTVAAVGVAVDGRTPGVRRLVRLVVGADADPVACVVAAPRWTAPDGLARLTIPRPHPALPALLRAGFRLVDRDTFPASRPDLVDPVRLLPDPGLR